MSAVNPRRPTRGQLETRATIALFQEQQEALEAQAVRRLAEIEVGHRRLALIARAIALIAWLVGVALVLLSVLSPATLVTAAAGTPLFLGFPRPARK